MYRADLPRLPDTYLAFFAEYKVILATHRDPHIVTMLLQPQPFTSMVAMFDEWDKWADKGRCDIPPSSWWMS